MNAYKLDTTDHNIIEFNCQTWDDFTCNLINTKRNYLFMLHVNIRSIKKNFAHIELIVSSSKNIVHLITEANLRNNEVSMFGIPDYTLYSELRTLRKGGSVLLYVHNTIYYTRINNYIVNEFEYISGELNSGKYIMGVTVVYRPPSTTKHRFLKELSTLLTTYPNKQDHVVMGDMNLDLKHNNPIIRQYMDSLCSLGFISGINTYTRIDKCGNRISESCIDHVFIRNSSYKAIRTAVVNSAPADHCITGCAILGALGPGESHHQKRLITVIVDRSVNEELLNVEWNTPMQYNNPNEIVHFIYNNFSRIYNNHKNTKYKKYKRNTCDWVDGKLKNMCKQRDKLYLIWSKDKNNMAKRLLYNKYRNKTNKYTQLIRNKKSCQM